MQTFRVEVTTLAFERSRVRVRMRPVMASAVILGVTGVVWAGPTAPTMDPNDFFHAHGMLPVTITGSHR